MGKKSDLPKDFGKTTILPGGGGPPPAPSDPSKPPVLLSPASPSRGYSIDPVTGERIVRTPYGNLQYQPLSTERPQDLTELLSRYQDVSKQGYSAPEYEARRAQAANLIKAQGQAAQRELLTQQARQGVKGGAAVAQQQRASQQLAAQRAALEQNLMLEDIKNRQAMMGQYGSLLGGAISREDRLAAENLKRDLAAQVVGVSAGVTEAGLDLAEKEMEQSGGLVEKYIEAIKMSGGDPYQNLSLKILEEN